MKTIYGIGAYGEPYKIVVTDKQLDDARTAQIITYSIPWYAEIFIPITAIRITGEYHNTRAEIMVNKYGSSILVDGAECKETILDDDLFSISDFYVSTPFCMSLSDFDINKDDYELVTNWIENHAKNK